MTPIGWGWAALVWGYALAWFLVNDWIEIWSLHVFDPKKPGLLTKK